MRTVVVDGGPLRLDDVVAVARGEAGAELDPGVAGRMDLTRNVVRDAVDRGLVMYGMTTGFGALADTRIAARRPRADAGVAPALARRRQSATRWPTTWSAPCCCCGRARWRSGSAGSASTCRPGCSSCSNHGLLPVIPGKGSVGASGDLAQLAHLALPLVGEGRLRRAGDADPQGRPAAELLAEEGIEPLVLRPQGGAVA